MDSPRDPAGVDSRASSARRSELPVRFGRRGTGEAACASVKGPPSMNAAFRPAAGEHIPTRVECAVLGMVVTFELPQHWGLVSIIRGAGTVSRQLAAASKQRTKWTSRNLAVAQPFVGRHQRANSWLPRKSTFPHRHGVQTRSLRRKTLSPSEFGSVTNEGRWSVSSRPASFINAARTKFQST